MVCFRGVTVHGHHYFWDSLCSSRKYPFPRPPWRAKKILRGGGVQKEEISKGVGGWLLRVFFLGVLSKIGKLSKTNSCFVEQAISYFTVNSLLKLKLLFSSMIFYLRLADAYML